VGRQKEDAGEDGIMRIFMLVIEYKWEVRKMENGTNGTFGTVVTDQKCIHSFLGGNLQEMVLFKELGVQGRVLLRGSLRNRAGGLDWMSGSTVGVT